MNMDEVQRNREAVSALADGQLRGAEFARVVELLHVDAEARASWNRFHLIGDVLRSADLARGPHGGELAAQVAARLQREPGILRPAPGADAAVPGSPGAAPTWHAGVEQLAPARVAMPAANRSGASRWRLVAAVASLTAVAAVGWNLLGGTAAPGAQPQLARAVAPPPVAVAAPQRPAAVAPAGSGTVQAAGERPVMIRDPRLDELLAAHKQLGGTSALQMPAGFLRNATFEGSER